jgi:hypothetical protein
MLLIDGSMLCHSSHVSDSFVSSSSTISPSFLRWKQHDQLILSALLPSLSVVYAFIALEFPNNERGLICIIPQKIREYIVRIYYQLRVNEI